MQALKAADKFALSQVSQLARALLFLPIKRDRQEINNLGDGLSVAFTICVNQQKLFHFYSAVLHEQAKENRQ